MARYLITSGSNFTPLTYEEMVRPIQIADQAHEAAATAYDELTAGAESVGHYISQEKDPISYKYFTDYMDLLNKAQEGLWSKGVNSQTRRDLIAARGKYKGDIGRVQKAIETRQARSKEYWDAMHKNPGDLVASADPGTESLDKYLEDDNFGQNWFSYSKSAMTKEVADDISAQANGILRSGKAPEGSEVKGQIEKFFTKGFTPQELYRVRTVLSGLMSPDENTRNAAAKAQKELNEFENMMVATSLSHVQKSGALEANLTPQSLNQLVDASIAGLSHGVLAPDLRYFTDPDVTLRNQKELARYTAGLKNTTPQNIGRTLVGNPIQLTSKGYNDLVKFTEGSSKHYRDETGNRFSLPVIVNGEQKQIDNDFSMGAVLYDTKERQRIITELGGIDIALGNKPQKATVNGVEIKTGALSNSDAKRLGIADTDNAIAVYTKTNGKWVLNDAGTQNLSTASSLLQQHIAKVQAENPQYENIQDYAVSPKKQKELREKYNYPDSEPWENFYDYVTAIETNGVYPMAMLVGADSPMQQYLLPVMINEFRNQWNQNADKKTGKMSKGSKYAPREVEEGNVSVSEAGVEDLKNILGAKGDGTIAWENITSIGSLLNEVVNPENPKIRFQSNFTPGRTYEVPAEMFGSRVLNSMKQAAPNLQLYSLPVLNPQATIQLSDADSMKLGKDINDLLVAYNFYPITVKYYGSDKKRNATAKEIMLNAESREYLYTALNYIFEQEVFGGIQDAIMIDHPQFVGNSNSKATGTTE